MIVSRLVATFTVLGLGLAMSYIYMPAQPAAVPQPIAIPHSTGSADAAISSGSAAGITTASPQVTTGTIPAQAITDMLAVVGSPSTEEGSSVNASGPFGENVRPAVVGAAVGAAAVQTSLAAGTPAPVNAAGARAVTGQPGGGVNAGLPITDAPVPAGIGQTDTDPTAAGKQDANSDQEESEARARARRSYRNVSRTPARRASKAPESVFLHPLGRR